MENTTRNSIRKSSFKKKTTLVLALLAFSLPMTAFASTYTKFGVHWFETKVFPSTTFGNATFAIHYTNRNYAHTGWVKVGSVYNRGGNTWVGAGKTSFTWVKGAWNGARDGGPIASGGKSHL